MYYQIADLKNYFYHFILTQIGFLCNLLYFIFHIKKY